MSRHATKGVKITAEQSLPYLHKPFGKGQLPSPNADLTNREIMAISGHRNNSSLQNYHNMPLLKKMQRPPYCTT